VGARLRGQVMRRTKGRANPQMVSDVMVEKSGQGG